MKAALGMARAGRSPSGWRSVLGMNRRNLYVECENHLRDVHRVNDKLATKVALYGAQIPHVPTLLQIGNRRDLAELDWGCLPDAWALKPNFGAQGAGILLARRRLAAGWQSTGGRPLARPNLIEHVEWILNGEYAMGDKQEDRALFEPLIMPHRRLAALVPFGLPDIRVICFRGVPVLTMARLPTVGSDGRANLHQGAVGAAIHLQRGCIERAVCRRRPIEQHPDTAAWLIGVEIPFWSEIVQAAVRCADLFRLGYLGVDVVVDARRGVMVMEVNARPGLEIQNVTGTGLRLVMGDR